MPLVPQTSTEIRSSFIKDDPTLMFINAGMNQFKACFLGDSPNGYKRVANF